MGPSYDESNAKGHENGSWSYMVVYWYGVVQKIRGPFSRVTMIRTTKCWGLHLCPPPIHGNPLRWGFQSHHGGVLVRIRSVYF